MISKVETSDLESTYFDFFSIIQKVEYIDAPTYTPFIKEFISSIVICEFINIDIENNKLVFTVEVKIKAICAMQDDSLHMIEDKFMFIREIEVPQKIEGIDIESIFYANRLDYEILIIESQLTILESKKILLEFQGVLGINYKRSFSLGLLMRISKFEKNIYICFENGKEIRQITFESDVEYSCIKWIKGKNFICYIKKIFEQDFLCCYNMIENSENDILTITNKIYDYTFIGNKKLVVDCEVNTERNLYIYDLQNCDFFKMFKNIENVKFENPFYREDSDKIFFVKKENNKLSLCSVKRDISNFEELCIFSNEKIFTCENFSFIINFDMNYILLYEFKRKKQIKIKYPFGNFMNLKFHAISDKQDIFAIAMDSDEGILFYIFEKTTQKFRYIKTEKKINKISSMCFNDRGDEIFISLEILGTYNLYKLSFNGKVIEILSLYCNELQLFKR